MFGDSKNACSCSWTSLSHALKFSIFKITILKQILLQWSARACVFRLVMCARAYLLLFAVDFFVYFNKNHSRSKRVTVQRAPLGGRKLAHPFTFEEFLRWMNEIRGLNIYMNSRCAWSNINFFVRLLDFSPKMKVSKTKH